MWKLVGSCLLEQLEPIMADTRNPSIHQHQSKARFTSVLCFLLAILTVVVTGWFIIEGIEATEPDSPARLAKIAAGILLLILELSAFGIAGQWTEYKTVLRSLGFFILALEITLMSVSQISIGMTAGKAATHGKDNSSELREQAKENREAAAALRADADKLRKSKHAWKQEEAAKKSSEAAALSRGAGASVADMSKANTAAVSTPVIEVVGERGLIALSIALSVALSLSGITLMHVAGSLRRRASGALPVDLQILELLQRVHGVPGGQAVPRLAPSPATPAAPAKQAATPVYSSWTGKGIPLATVGALGVMGAAQTVQAAPAAPTAAPVNADRAAAMTPVNVNPLSPVNDYPPAVVTPVNVDPQAPAKKARKARVAHDGAVMDTGVGEHDGYRYRRALAGVKAGTMRPSRDGLFAAVGASPPTAKRYIEAMAAAGEVVPNPNGCGWVRAQKGGAS
jgi:hypothetical protein